MKPTDFDPTMLNLSNPTSVAPSTFTPVPVAIAISAAFLFGCSAEQSAQTSQSVEPRPPQLREEANNPAKAARLETETPGPETALADQDASGRPRLATKQYPARHDQAQPDPGPDSPALYQQVQTASAEVDALKQAAQKPPQPRSAAPNTRPANATAIAESERNSAAGLSSDAGTAIQAPLPSPRPQLDYAEPPIPHDREQYAAFTDNPLKSTAVDPLSTFGIDVDTASYALTRQGLNAGYLPRPESVRTEEFINYFQYDYPLPPAGDHPFSVATEIAAAPWAENRHLLSVGLKGYEVSKADLPPLNLVLLIDVSGSMSSANKLPLAKAALKMLVKQLRPQDRISMVAYAGAAGLVLEPTPGDQKHSIINALERLQSGGSTAGGAGIQLAYKTARQHHKQDAISRVVLLSDGDFNVGTRSTEALKRMVEKQRSSGVSLSVLTFGRGNIRDELMNSLAEIGNGNAGYIDSALEAQKYLVDEMTGSMMTIAKDVKAQVEFNPALVDSYRLLGYETRHLEHHQFNDDRKDAGEIGAGHAVTALYELTLKGAAGALTPSLRYPQRQEMPPQRFTPRPESTELAFLKLRYKPLGSDNSILMTQPIYRRDIKADYHQASDNFRWAAAVAGAAQKARGIHHIGRWSYQDSIELGKTASGNDPMGYRGEFIRLLAVANSLDQAQTDRSERGGMIGPEQRRLNGPALTVAAGQH